MTINDNQHTNLLNSVNDGADNETLITNPESALAAAAQAEKDGIENNQPSQASSLSVATSKVKDASEFGKVAVIYGGSSNERSVSLDSGAAVLQALQNQGV
ncbi:D-alanine--D-alanine ligase, partial [Psychrobacter sp. 1U2]